MAPKWTPRLGRRRTGSESGHEDGMADSVDSLTSVLPRSSPESMQASTGSLGRVETTTSSRSGHSSPGLQRAFASTASLFSSSFRDRASSRAADSSGLSDSEIADGFEDWDSFPPHFLAKEVDEAHKRQRAKLAKERSQTLPRKTHVRKEDVAEPLLPSRIDEKSRSDQASSSRYGTSTPSAPPRPRVLRGEREPTSPPSDRRRGNAAGQTDGNLSDVEA